MDVLDRVKDMRREACPLQAARITLALGAILAAESDEFAVSIRAVTVDLRRAYNDNCVRRGMKPCRSVSTYLSGVSVLGTTHIDMTQSYLGHAGCVVFIECVVGRMPNLTSLVLVRQGLDVDGVDMLYKCATAEGVRGLTHLDVSRNELLGASAAVVLLRLVKRVESLIDISCGLTAIPLRYAVYIQSVIDTRKIV